MSLSKSSNRARPLSPEQVSQYFGEVDRLSGGRLGDYATTGTAPVAYQGLTADDIRALGGLGATREQKARQGQTEALSQIQADPSLSVFQRQRARQLTNRDFTDALDAIAKETESAITGLKSQEAARAFEADRANAALRREDLEALAAIFFGGRGQSSSGRRFGFSLPAPPK